MFEHIDFFSAFWPQIIGFYLIILWVVLRSRLLVCKTLKQNPPLQLFLEFVILCSPFVLYESLPNKYIWTGLFNNEFWFYNPNSHSYYPDSFFPNISMVILMIILLVPLYRKRYLALFSVLITLAGWYVLVKQSNWNFDVGGFFFRSGAENLRALNDIYIYLLYLAVILIGPFFAALTIAKRFSWINYVSGLLFGWGIVSVTLLWRYIVHFPFIIFLYILPFFLMMLILPCLPVWRKKFVEAYGFLTPKSKQHINNLRFASLTLLGMLFPVFLLLSYMDQSLFQYQYNDQTVLKRVAEHQNGTGYLSIIDTLPMANNSPMIPKNLKDITDDFNYYYLHMDKDHPESHYYRSITREDFEIICTFYAPYMECLDKLKQTDYLTFQRPHWVQENRINQLRYFLNNKIQWEYQHGYWEKANDDLNTLLSMNIQAIKGSDEGFTSYNMERAYQFLWNATLAQDSLPLDLLSETLKDHRDDYCSNRKTNRLHTTHPYNSSLAIEFNDLAHAPPLENNYELYIWNEYNKIQIATELYRYHRQYNQFPDSISDLVPEFLEREPLQPKTGTPYPYNKFTDQGFNLVPLTHPNYPHPKEGLLLFFPDLTEAKKADPDDPINKQKTPANAMNMGFTGMGMGRWDPVRDHFH